MGPVNAATLTPEKLEILAGKDARLDSVQEVDASGKVISERPIILNKTVLTGGALKAAFPGTDQFAEPVVQIEFTAEGSKKFYEITRKNVGKPIAIVLDGKVISAPNVNEPIAGGKAQISGNFSVQEMRDLVIKLKAGALPVPVEIVSNTIVGPMLGRDSVEKSKKAALIGYFIVFLFMTLYYRLPGLMAAIALVVFMFLSLTCLKLLGATLTLPGIAGLILTMGMAVDANVIIFERIKEERRGGQTLKAGIESGFNRAFVTILDSNITTLIAAAVLFWLGTGSIKGFAITLSIGILVSMFTAVVITKLLLQFVSNFSKPNEGILFKA